MAEPLQLQLSETVTAALDRLAGAAVDATPAMAQIAGYLETEIEYRFQSETDPAGLPWKPSLRVAGYTRKDGERIEGDGGQTLTLHGDLRRSMRSNFGADFAEAGPEASGGAGVYAAIHQFGGRITPRAGKALRTPFGPRGAVTIPARPYLGWNDDTRDEVEHIVVAFALEALSGSAVA